ncbi:50S ribosome-binding GTPase family protein [Synechococcus sp. BIOS-E4-1]|uniref:YcjF family protein n=1 Tax=Synechococcus sp. BIOS-E4-1 TaxID=1400864 RepID=UPI0016454966|nr:GTP-binding protein [Synechococcus sp. BIOS-E4-1]QNI54506.1 50S ribosome-binding GTPase family protein [Synechococcus sp. BIOS-E4-1]
MRGSTRWILFGAAGLIALMVIGLVLQGIRNLLWDLSYWLPPWLVGPVLLIGTVLLVAVVIQVGLPWLRQWRTQRQRQNTSSPKDRPAPTSSRDAAEQSLSSVDRLLERLQDDVARQSLLQERQRVARELERGDLVLVVFGTGSSGKTSLIRALLKEIVGDVGAAMGSTGESRSYRLRLKGLERGVLLVDTPGILEAGQEGRGREQEARRRASRADLMIVVVDGDLRKSELEVIQSLSGLGKRLVLVLNKCDLRGEEEERRLLQLLKRRCSEWLQPEDVIPASASPQSLPRPGQRPVQPPAEIGLLVRRLAAVLHADGEELLADNILLQCRDLGSAGRDLLDRQRSDEARRIIDRYTWISAGVVAATPLPGVDLLGTAAVNAQMVMEVGAVYGIQLTRSRAQELAVSVGRTLAGLGVVKGGVALIGTALSVNLPTLLLGRAVQGVAAGWLTRIAGASFMTYFQQDQDWGDGGVQDVVQHHYELNRRDRSLQDFLQAALQRVVEPLQQEAKKRLPPRPGPRAAEDASDRGYRAP